MRTPSINDTKQAFASYFRPVLHKTHIEAVYMRKNKMRLAKTRLK